MKAVWLEGEAERLRELARACPHPYQLLSSDEGHALFVVAVDEDFLERVRPLGARVYLLEEEGCGRRSIS